MPEQDYSTQSTWRPHGKVYALSGLLTRERPRLQHVLQLMSGTVVAQLIPVAAAPLLTRLYTSADLGVLTLYVSLATILATIAAGRYELALGLPKRTRQTADLFHLCITIVAAFSVLLALAVTLEGRRIAILLGGLQWQNCLYLLPLTVLFTGLFQASNYWLNRGARFGIMARVKIVQTGITTLVSLAAGIARVGAMGLIAATVIGYAAATATAAAAMRDSFRNGVISISPKRSRSLAIRYRSFPLLSAPGALADVLALQLPAIIIAHSYDASTVGYFGLTMRVIGIPSVFLGYAMGQVYYQSVANTAAQRQPVRGLILNGMRLLMLVSVVPYAMLLFFGPSLFGWAFGQTWKEAGQFASLLAPAFWLRFVASSLSLSLPALNRNDLAIRWQIINLVTVTVLLGWASQYSIRTFMVAFDAQYLLVYALYLWMIFHAASRQSSFL